MKTKPKRTGIKIQTVKENISVKYDEEEEVIGASDLFGGDDDYYEEYVEKTPIKKEEPVKQPEKEEEKVGEKTEEEKIETKKQDDKPQITVIGYSAIVEGGFETGEPQVVVSCVYQTEEKIKIRVRSLHLNILPSHLQLCDFAKYAKLKSESKKKIQSKVIEEIVTGYRKNIVHYGPFFEPKVPTKSNGPLVCAEETELDLSEYITKVISISETNSSKDETDTIYILGANKDNKAVLLKIKTSSTSTKGNQSNDATASTTSPNTDSVIAQEILNLDLSSTYTILNQDSKVAIYGKNKVFIINANKLEEQFITDNSQMKAEAVIKILKKTEVSKVDVKIEEKVEESKVEEKAEENKEEKVEEDKIVEEVITKEDITVDLIKEGDCDLTELDQIFKSSATSLHNLCSQSQIGEKVFEKSKNLDKIKLKLFFRSNNSQLKSESALKQSDISFHSQPSQVLLDKQKQIDLIVHSHTGSQVNPTSPPSVVIDKANAASYNHFKEFPNAPKNGQALNSASNKSNTTTDLILPSKSYISNYPKPTIIFTHQQEQKFVPTQFTISSKFHREKANADSYPVGAGLIFCANSLKEFENAKKYYQIQTKKEYEKWLNNRLELKLPLRESDPAAFFILDGEREVTVNFENPKACKYVLLMPTDFRKKPIKFTKKFYSNNCEIETFRVIGMEVKHEGDVEQENEAQVKSQVVQTNAKVTVQVMQGGRWVDFQEIKDISIKKIESLTRSYCVSLLDRIQSSITGSFSTTIDLSHTKNPEGIRILISEGNSQNQNWNYRKGYFVVYEYPSELSFNSKGLRRITEQSILDVYTNTEKLNGFVKQLIDVVHDRTQLEYIRNQILQHVIELHSPIHLKALQENFKFMTFFDDLDFSSYSDNFKTTLFKAITKIGVENVVDNGKTFLQYIDDKFAKIQDKGDENFDISLLHFFFLFIKNINQETCSQALNNLFNKVLPELEKSKNYYPLRFDSSLQNHIQTGFLITRAKLKYEITVDLNTVHSIDCIKLIFDEDTNRLVLSMNISVFTVDENDQETLLTKTQYGDEVYQLVTKKSNPEETNFNELSNYLILSLEGIQNKSRYYRIKINHIGTSQSKHDGNQDPIHAVVPLFYGQNTGAFSLTNNTFKASKTEISQSTNMIEETLKINGLEFNLFEKGSAYFVPKKFTKKELKAAGDQEGSRKLILTKRNEQIEFIKNREYEKAHELTNEIIQIKTKSRSKLTKYNNMTLSEVLMFSSDILNSLCPDDGYSKDNNFVASMSNDMQYELLKNIVEWYLLPKDEVSKVISLKPAHKVIKAVLKNIPNANSVFFDMVEKLLKKKNQTHKKIFETLESFISEMSVVEIIDELLKRLGLNNQVTEKAIDSPKVLTEIISQIDQKTSKETMWIIVGTLQLINKKIDKVPKEQKNDCMINLMFLATLRFNASEYEHSMYYKLVIGMITECFSKSSADRILTDATLLIRVWFNVLTLSTDPDLYSVNLKFIEEIISSAVAAKKKANDIVHNVLVWYSDINSNKEVEEAFKGTIFDGVYENNSELFSTHYCQAIDLFLGSFKSDAEDEESNKLVSEIFNNIMSALNKPSKSASFAKIWNELFKCLAIIGSNEENVHKFVTTFLSLPGDIQDNLYTHFDIDNVNLDSAKQSNTKKFTVQIIYQILKSFFKYGLRDEVSNRDQIRVYTICDDLICKLATSEPCNVNQSVLKTPVNFTEAEYIETLHLFNEYLICFLNKGYYNHMAGASYVVLARLKMGVHLSYLVYNSEDKGKKYFDKFIDEFDHVTIEEKSEIFEKQIVWLLLNNPTSKGKSDPCSVQHNRICKTMLEKIPQKKEIVLELLPKVMKQVIKFDNMILNNCHKLGVERCSAFQNNSNTIISTLFNVCFNDKELFNDFLIKMKGFDFFLQRLFTKTEESKVESTNEEEEIISTSKSAEKLDKLLIENLFEESPKPVIASANSQEVKKDDKSKEKKGIDKVNFTDAGKTMKLIQSTVGVENQTQDWVLYKNGQRNRIVFKHIDKACKSDFIMRFECTEAIEVSDITMGLIYYWGNYDQDMHYEPMQVF